jgi:holo-[acyl-carrier protein] synthase
MIEMFGKISSDLRILGIGTDICACQRIADIYHSFGSRFVQRLCHATEIESFYSQPSQQSQLAYLAKRFAAKEAFAKALGTGIGSQAFLKEIVSEKSHAGVPRLVLLGKTHETALLLAQEKGFTNYNVFLSLSDEKDYALAFVILAGHS